MGPVKFDDLHKTANDLLSDDYQTSSVQFKAKQKTNLDGAVLTTTVDFLPEDKIVTPGKLSFKFPKPFGTSQVSIDKLELDKGGKFKCETSFSKVHPDLKLELKSDLASLGNVAAGVSYSGVKDTVFKLETKPMKPDEFKFEATRQLGAGVTCGMKFGMKNLTSPDLGANLASGPLFVSLLSKESFKVFTAHGSYKLCPPVSAAATYEYGGKKSGQYSVGLAYSVVKGTTLKAKVQQDKTVSASLKHELTKGFTLLAGAKYNLTSGSPSYGFQLSVE